MDGHVIDNGNGNGFQYIQYILNLGLNIAGVQDKKANILWYLDMNLVPQSLCILDIFPFFFCL